MMLLNFLKRTLTGTPTEQNPADAIGGYAHGLDQFRDGAHAAALATMQAALRTDPANADIHHVIAKCHQALGNSSAMHAAIASALAANGNHLATHQLLARIAMPGPSYTERIAEIHGHLRPKAYLEIGVAQGRTIALAHPDTLAVGVDPAPRIDEPPGPNTQIFALPSDEFFARGDLASIFGNQPVDLAFIDGMHHFEYALRDFINAERLATRRSSILVHDTYPLNRVTAERDRKTIFWSGDIWRLVLALKKYRPDLAVHTIAAAPTGLTMIRNLDPGSRVLTDRLDAIVAEFLAVDYGALEQDKAAALNAVANDWNTIRALLDRAPSATAP